MATYMELFALRSNSDLQDKVSVAVAKKAQTLLDGETPSAAAVAWAQEAIQSPKTKADALLNYVLVKNSELTAAQISGAADSAIQTNVDAAVDVLISGGA
jgi:hypothetical protein